VAQVVLPELRELDTDMLSYGKFMFDTGVPAANCGDLAQLACYLAFRRGVAADQLAVVGVFTEGLKGNQKGADHAFAAYGNADMLDFLATMVSFPTMKDIKSSSFRDKVYAIDPWANLVCSINQYPAKAADKMRSWASYGKRVLWVYNRGNSDYEWCQPDGEYLTVFAKASLSFNVCG
jgi:hypothetical protein